MVHKVKLLSDSYSERVNLFIVVDSSESENAFIPEVAT